jgi:hypothetical protein
VAQLSNIELMMCQKLGLNLEQFAAAKRFRAAAILGESSKSVLTASQETDISAQPFRVARNNRPHTVGDESSSVTLQRFALRWLPHRFISNCGSLEGPDPC